MSVERPQKPGKDDPKSPFADNMLQVEIPNGTILHEGRIRGGEVHKQFGISHVLHGTIAHQSGERAEGTVLFFNDGTFRVDINRRDLTAEDINHVNKLVRDLEEIAVIFRFLPKQVKSSEELIKNLRISQGTFRSLTNLKNIDPTNIITELGILIEKMKSSYAELQQKWKIIISELSSAGVVSIWDQHGGPLSSVPVEKMAQTYTAERNVTD